VIKLLCTKKCVKGVQSCILQVHNLYELVIIRILQIGNAFMLPQDFWDSSFLVYFAFWAATESLGASIVLLVFLFVVLTFYSIAAVEWFIDCENIGKTHFGNFSRALYTLLQVIPCGGESPRSNPYFKAKPKLSVFENGQFSGHFFLDQKF